MKLHREDNRPNQYGGTNYRTLCRRTNRSCDDGMNVADSDDEVTCKFCLNIMADRAALRQKEGKA